jgi:hypothetical protein
MAVLLGSLGAERLGWLGWLGLLDGLGAVR